MNPAAACTDMKLSKLLLVCAEQPQNVFLEAQFNPKELTKALQLNLTRGSTFSDVLEQTSTTKVDLKLTLFFDGIEKQIDVCQRYVTPLEHLIDTGIAPTPLVRLVWGCFVFKGAIVGLDVKYTMFLPSGAPVRAEVGLSMMRACQLLHGLRWDRH